MYILFALLVPVLLWLLCGKFIIFCLKNIRVYTPTKQCLEKILQNSDAKRNTPFLGGIFIVLFAFIPVLYLNKFYISSSLSVSIMFFSLLFFVLGLWDDVRKFSHGERGIRIRTRIAFHVFFSLLFFSYMFFLNKNCSIDLYFKILTVHGFIYFLWVISVLGGTSNATNFSDGIDCLASILVIIPLISICAMLALSIYDSVEYVFNTSHFLQWEDKMSLILLNSSVIGSIVGFMFFNKNPAKIFMGDSGALFLGAFLALNCLVLSLDFLFFIMIFPLFLEFMSVFLQILCFKLFKFRPFPIAPFHHVLQMRHLSEQKIFFIFFLANVICNLFAFLLFILRSYII